MRRGARVLGTVLLACIGLAASVARAQSADSRLDYLSFAQGAIPIRVEGEPSARSNFEHAVKATDGAIGGFTYTSLVDPSVTVEFVYELPALTTFDYFGIPNVLETPSPSQTFARDVAVYGSSESPDGGYVLLASGTLSTHSSAGQETELTLGQAAPVRWVKLALSNGIDVQREKMFLEFSEIVGRGVQEPVPVPADFGGGWRGRGVAMVLRQDGPTVSGCYDRTGDLSGTIGGRILRATGVGRDDGVESAFIATIGSDGKILGVRSTNGSPFRLFSGERTDDVAALRCTDPPAPVLGCGSVIHGIRFAFDSAEITPESEAVVASLYDGLIAASTATILVEGHTSSEGAEDYNQRLSEMRAQAVASALEARGIGRGRLASAGLGEGRPIATNEDESGRSLNRRVEIHCRD